MSTMSVIVVYLEYRDHSGFREHCASSEYCGYRDYYEYCLGVQVTAMPPRGGVCLAPQTLTYYGEAFTLFWV